MNLASVPANVSEALAQVDLLDDSFAVGLGRLSDERLIELAGFAAAFATTPLGGRLEAVAASLSRGVLDDATIVDLSIARAAVMGAAHDALRAQAAEAVGIVSLGETPDEPGGPRKLDDELVGPLTGARLWLGEIAQVGFAQLSSEALLPFGASIERLAAQPELRRAAAVLAGFHAELVEAMPLGSRSDVPDRRWGDLWVASVLATIGPVAAQRRAVAGTLTPFGVDVRHHDRVLTCTLWSLADLDGDDVESRVVTVPFMAWKVDALKAPDAVRALPEPAVALLNCVAKKTTVTVTGQLGSDGTLIVGPDDVFEPGAKADPFSAVADAGPLAVGVMHARDRHPIHIALPVVGTIEDGSGFAIADGPVLPIAAEHVSSMLEAKSGTLEEAAAAIGLLRFDDGWQVQPLTAKVGRGLWGVGEVAAAAGKAAKATDAGPVLRERASRLLRS